MSGNKRICFTSGTYSGSFGNFNGSNNSICIAPGATVNWNKDFNGLTVEVYGTLNYNGGNFNGSGNQINVYSGGLLSAGTGVSQMGNVIVNVSSGGTMTINTTGTFTFQNSGGIINNGTVNATKPSTFQLNGNTGLQNTGNFYATRLEISDGAPTGSGAVLRQNTGNIIVTQYAYVHGYYMNAAGGTFKVTGPNAGGSYSFTNGDVGNTNQFINNGTLNITGPLTVNGPLTDNGSIFVNGDVTLNKVVTGANGKMGMSNGISRINSGGGYTGTNMKVCDQSTSSNNFSSGANAAYSVDCASVYSALPLLVISFDAVENNGSVYYFTWTTSAEVNVATIQLQASQDGNNFTTVETINAKNTAGPNNYSSSKINANNYSYYRLAIVNKDGKIDYSKIIYAKLSDTTEVSIFPNPVTNLTFNVKTPSSTLTVINVFSTDGRLLFSSSVKGQLQYKTTLPGFIKNFPYLNIQVINAGKSNAFAILNM